MTTARKLITADELLDLPDDGYRYELVRGALFKTPPSGFMHTVVTGRIGRRIGNFVEEHGLGFIGGPEASAYMEQNPDTVRAADYSLIPTDLIPDPPPARGYVSGMVPALVVEVISPDGGEAAATRRARMWLYAGVRLALVAYIATQEIVAHHADGTVQRFGMRDTLTCEPLLPGFACLVVDIFAW